MAAQPQDLERSAGETDRQYLDRLTGLDTAGWSVDDLTTLTLLVRDARLAVAVRARAALEQVKRLVRDLPEPQRRELARWLAEGCPGDRASSGGGERPTRDRGSEATHDPLPKEFVGASDRGRR